jgi:hypothetical protein
MKSGQPRATVIIPTFGEARFAEWALKSVQRQTVRELEICVICDGSPAPMVEFLRGFATQDPRVKLFTYPKSPRNGEPYRDEVIRQTSGAIICYCAHDDLWLPDHVESLERTLSKHHFTNSTHASIDTSEESERTGDPFWVVHSGDLQDPASLARLRADDNFFGLTFGGHTREAYLQLAEGWVTTPIATLPTDLYMWKKFVQTFPQDLATTHKVTALGFPFPPRREWTENQRYQELEGFYQRIRDAAYVEELRDAAAAHLYRKQVELAESLARERDDLATRYAALALKQHSLKYLLRRLGGEVRGRVRGRPGRKATNSAK